MPRPVAIHATGRFHLSTPLAILIVRHRNNDETAKEEPLTGHYVPRSHTVRNHRDYLDCGREFVLRNQIADRLDTISQSAYRAIDLQHEIIRGQLGSIASDLLFLAGQNELASYLETGGEQFTQ